MMAHEVPWDRRIVEEFIDQAMLSYDEQWLLRTRIQGMPRCQQADVLGLSERSLDRMIRRLKNKYDRAQVSSSILPPRKAGTWNVPQ